MKVLAMCRYILSIRIKRPGAAEESAVLQWVEQATPGAELQQKTPGNLSFSIAQEVCLICNSERSCSHCTVLHHMISSHVSKRVP